MSARNTLEVYAAWTLTSHREIVRQRQTITGSDFEDFVFAVALKRGPLDAWLLVPVGRPIEDDLLTSMTNGKLTAWVGRSAE